MWSPTRAAGLRCERLLEPDLERRVLDLVADLELAIEADLAGLAIELGDDLVLLAVLAPRRGLDRLLHRDDHLVDADALLVGDALRDPDQLQPAQSGRRLDAMVNHGRQLLRSARAAAISSSVSTSLAFLTAA